MNDAHFCSSPCLAQVERYGLHSGPVEACLLKYPPGSTEAARRGATGGLALRFARVFRDREDRTAAEADTITNIRRMSLPRRV